MPVRHRLGSSTLDTGAAIVRSDPPPVTAGRFSIRQLKPRYVGAFCLPTHQLEPQQRPRGSGAREGPIQTLKCRRVDRRWPGPAVDGATLHPIAVANAEPLEGNGRLDRLPCDGCRLRSRLWLRTCGSAHRPFPGNAMENDKCGPALALLHAIRNAQNRRQLQAACTENTRSAPSSLS
jgi:hypothetical protein